MPIDIGEIASSLMALKYHGSFEHFSTKDGNFIPRQGNLDSEKVNSVWVYCFAAGL